MKIGLIGYGTIGCGVAELLLEKRRHPNLELVKIADIDLERKRDFMPDKSLFTTDAFEILNDPEIDTVIELMGGIEPARSYILSAFANGKDVVTANKALLSSCWKEIMEKANSCKRRIRFEASVAGGIPLLSAVFSGLGANKIEAVYGIINGTTNYILTRMEKTKESFSNALAEAQKKGYAEACPSFDIDGIDTAHKIAILASLCFGKTSPVSSIYTEGIRRITHFDISCAAELGYSIKLLGISRMDKDRLSIRVHPTMLKKEHMLSSVSDVYNAVYIKPDLTGPLLFFGRGAGRYPTASAIYADLLALKRGEEFCIPEVEMVEPINITEITSKYYIRVQAEDMPGVLAMISGVLAENNVSIASCIQKERGKAVPIIMITHEAREGAIVSSLSKIDKSPFIKEESLKIRIEEI
ncbi:MAG: homoserine dehydrogenase [bacterium]|nr:homoserine dehydrogenase [bacterium]